MQITKCDRCKREIKEGEDTKFASNGEVRVHCYGTYEFDLCRDCTQELRKFFDSVQVLEKTGEDNANVPVKCGF